MLYEQIWPMQWLDYIVVVVLAATLDEGLELHITLTPVWRIFIAYALEATCVMLALHIKSNTDIRA